ncbi:MAG: hypothetical protein JW723_13515 [Bacteroidales bacterium]|nr:hypothetical protein [Bacteroidales bacterium]
MKKTIISLIILLPVLTLQTGAQLTRIRESDTIFKGPESVAYDAIRKCLYISNYNKYPRNGMMYNEDYITKTDLSGNVLENKLIGGLTCPTGICVLENRLYIVERFGLVVYDLNLKKVENRYRINDNGFINDVTVDPEGTVYISDSGSDVIYRIKNGMLERWLNSEEINKTNGILIDGDVLIAGVNADSSLKAVNINDKTITKIASLPSGIIDGIKKCGNDYLVSRYEGSLYLVKNSGKILEILNTVSEQISCADFEYIVELDLLIIPALKNNKLFFYKYDGGE